MIGGKWTTFRAFAEHTTDAVLVELGRQRTTGTFDLAIGGGRGYSAGSAIETELVRTFRVTAARAAHLSDTYGRHRRPRSWRSPRGAPDDRPLGVGTELTVAEIAFLTQQEYAVRLGDLILRRTTLAITGTIDTGLTEAIASVAGRELGWDRRAVAPRSRRSLWTSRTITASIAARSTNVQRKGPRRAFEHNPKNQPHVHRRWLPRCRHRPRGL